MLILILIDVQYLQKIVFSFGKGLNDQNHSSSGSQHLIKKIPHQKLFGRTHKYYLEDSTFLQTWF